MTSRSRVIVATLSLSASLLVGWTMFVYVRPGNDLQAYGVSFVALLLAVCASAILYPMRVGIGGRIFCAIALLDAAFWALEFFGGVAWYVLDKIARHAQHA